MPNAVSKTSRTHYLRFVQALAIGPLVAAMSCAPAMMTGDTGNPGDTGDAVADTQLDAPSDGAVCTCCPTARVEGDQCAQYEIQPDSGVTVLFDGAIIVSEGGVPPMRTTLPPPMNSRWCLNSELASNGCPIVGPLDPPEIAI